MKYLLDTCLLSELIKSQPDPGVVEWIESQPEDNLLISVLTIGELHKGIGKLQEGRRKQTIRHWLENDVLLRFDGRILPFDLVAAEQWGHLAGESLRVGRPLPLMDSLIAAVGIAGNLIVVTRNSKDFEGLPVKLFNPWAMV